MATIPITKLGAEKLKQELHILKTVDRPWVINAIAEARAQGDLSENAEYDAAKDRQGFIEGRIQEIESKLSVLESEKETLNEQIALNNATEMVNSFKNKLGEKTEVIEKWIAQAKNNFDLTKDLLESLPLNVVANKIEVEEEKVQAKTAQSIMLDIQNKTKHK